jgi:putative transposase
LLWVAVGLILRNAWVRFRSGGERRWTLGAACLLLLTEILTAQANVGRRADDQAPNGHARPPT